MFSPVRVNFHQVSLVLTLGVLFVAAGCPGDAGILPPIIEPDREPILQPDPPTAPSNDVAGQPAFQDSSGLPGLVITILKVTTADTEFVPQIGKSVAVTFTLKTRDGKSIAPSDLNRFSTYISGPTGHYQRVLPAEGDVAKIHQNDDGSNTYVFSAPLPETFAAPYNDSPEFGTASGELTGQALTPGTYSIGVEARRPVARNDESFNDGGDAVLDFLIGDAPLTHRQVVIAQNCMQCHGQVSVHGGNRLSVSGCVLCHTAGGEDRKSSDPNKATAGVSIQFSNMIHRIHRGYDLPLVKATKNSAKPYKYEIIGFGDSVNDFTDVEFPRMPGGTGFNEQTRNCGACHDGATDGERAYTNPNAAACLGCHDDVNLSNGTKLDPANGQVIAGTLTKDQINEPSIRVKIGGFNHMFDDTQCTLCHAIGTALDVKVVHLPVLNNPNMLNGIKVVIISVTGNTGAGFFNPGDRPVITFKLVDKNNNPVGINDANNVATLNFVLSGPVENYQVVLPTTGTSATVKSTTFDSTTGAVTGQTINVTPNTGNGPFTYTAAALPANYRAPVNDSTAFTFANGDGELNGKPLVAGSYTVALWASHQFPIPSTSRFREPSDTAFSQIRIGSTGATAAYSGIISDAKCNACHGNLAFHGNGRKNVSLCVVCHVAGVEDNTTAPGTAAPEPDTVNFKVMIHKIHNARNLSVTQNGGKYDLGTNVFAGSLPYMQGEARNCTACHANDAWKVPVERDDVRIWKVACTSCHDSESARAHADINTTPSAVMGNPANEACMTCHGEGRSFAVELFHRIP